MKYQQPQYQFFRPFSILSGYPLKHMLRRFIKLGLLTIYSLAFGGILFFLLIEIFPDMLSVLPLQGIKYYALKSDYVSDPELVFVYRKTDLVKRSRFTGDSFKPEYGIPAQNN